MTRNTPTVTSCICAVCSAPAATVGTRFESDAVFAVKDSLIRHFVRHDESDEASRQFALDPPFYTVEFDFVLKKGGLT